MQLLRSTWYAATFVVRLVFELFPRTPPLSVRVRSCTYTSHEYYSSRTCEVCRALCTNSDRLMIAVRKSRDEHPRTGLRTMTDCIRVRGCAELLSEWVHPLRTLGRYSQYVRIVRTIKILLLIFKQSLLFRTESYVLLTLTCRSSSSNSSSTSRTAGPYLTSLFSLLFQCCNDATILLWIT